MLRGVIARILWSAALMACWPSGQARAADVEAHEKLVGQVRDSYQTGDAEAPFWIYSDLGLNRLRHGINFETFFSLDENFGPNDGGADFFAGVLHAPTAIPMLEMSLGRQFLSEGPRGANLADAGRVTFDPSTAGVPVAFSVYGGAPRYFEPTFSSPSISQDEQMYGARMIAKGLRDGYANVGYLQYIREGNTLSQLLQVNAGKSLPDLPGTPNLYGYFAYDAGDGNVEQATAGAQAFLGTPRLQGNLEATYYDPAGTGKLVLANPNLREDPLFNVFSVSDEKRFKSTLRYIVAANLTTYANFGYQRYQNSVVTPDGTFVSGYLGGAGLNWLPGGDGLEAVRLEYYVANSRAGNLNGGRFYYDNWVYDRIHFRTKVDVAYYEKITNQKETAVATLVGLGYDLLPGLYCETYMEANHNERFDADIRLGVTVIYDWSHRFGQQSAPPSAQAAAPAAPEEAPVPAEGA
jgi:hypothetical protein